MLSFSDPIAQTFQAVVPESSSGMYLTQIGLFFKEKDPNLGVTVYLVETLAGAPNTNKVLGKARLEAADIPVDATTALEEAIFVFDVPVYLNNLDEYAFVVSPDGASPLYKLWSARVGEVDISTGEQIYSNPYSGTLYTSSNINSWTDTQLEDLKFKLYRARFTQGTGSAEFINEDDDFITTAGFTLANTSNPIEVGDFVLRTVGGSVVTNPANTSYAFGIVQSTDDLVNYVAIDGSGGNFVEGSTIQVHRPISGANLQNLSQTAYPGGTLIASANVISINNFDYQAIVPRFGTLIPAKTSITLQYKGRDQNYVLDSAWTDVTNDIEYEYNDKTRSLVTKTKEVRDISGGKSGRMKLTMTTENSYISPVIDLRRKSALLIQNQIAYQPNTVNEHLGISTGLSRYISKNITLDDKIGNAEDMKAYIGAYRPYGTEIDLYVKMIGSDDGEPFDSKLWTKMDMVLGNDSWSSPNDEEDILEYEFDMPTVLQFNENSVRPPSQRSTAYKNASGIVQYQRYNGDLIVGFKTYCFKIVLKSTFQTGSADAPKIGILVPKLNDFRAIALMK